MTMSFCHIYTIERSKIFIFKILELKIVKKFRIIKKFVLKNTFDQKSSNFCESILLKSRPPRVGWGHNWGSNVTKEYNWKIFFPKSFRAEKLKVLWKHLNNFSSQSIVFFFFKLWSAGVWWGHNRGYEL